mgnify:CR=1 FL=1
MEDYSNLLEIEPTTCVPALWLHAGAYLKSKTGEIGDFWVKTVSLGPTPEECVVRIFRVGLGDTLRRTVPEVYEQFEPTGRQSVLPPHT